ncbi:MULTISPECIES: hypothetical protein [unclassified Mycoplasma]
MNGKNTIDTLAIYDNIVQNASEKTSPGLDNKSPKQYLSEKMSTTQLDSLKAQLTQYQQLNDNQLVNEFFNQANVNNEKLTKLLKLLADIESKVRQVFNANKQVIIDYDNKISEINAQNEDKIEKVEDKLLTLTGTKNIDELTTISPQNAKDNSLLKSLWNDIELKNKELKQKQALIEQNNQKISELEAKIKQQEASSLALENDLAQARINLGTKDTKIQQLQNQIVSLQQQKDSFEKQNQTLSTQKQELETQKQQLSKQVETKNTQIQTLETQKTQLQEQISTLEAKISSLTSELDTLKKSQVSLSSQVSNLQEQIKQKDTRISQLESELAQEKQKSKEEDKQRISQLEREKQELQSARDNLQSQLTTTTRTLLQVQGDKTRKESEIRQNERTISDLRSQVSSKDNDIRQKQTTINSLNSQITSKDSQISTLSREIQSLKQQKASLEATIQAKDSEIRQKDQTIEEQRGEIATLKGKKTEEERLREENSELKKQVETLNATISENTKEINRLKGENRELNLYILDYQDWQKFSEAKKFIEKFNNILVFSKQYLEFLQGDEVINWERPNIRQGEYHSWNTPNTEFFKQVEKGQKDFDSLFSDIDLTNKAKVAIVRSLKPDNYMLNWNLLKEDFEKLKKLQTLKKVKELTSRQRTNSEKQEMKQLVWTIDNVYKQVNLVDLTTEVSVPFSTPWYRNWEEMYYAVAEAQDDYQEQAGLNNTASGKKNYIEGELTKLGVEDENWVLSVSRSLEALLQENIMKLQGYKSGEPGFYEDMNSGYNLELSNIRKLRRVEDIFTRFIELANLMERVKGELARYERN